MRLVNQISVNDDTISKIQDAKLEIHFDHKDET